jgi:cation diffusion facilitator family transporter
MVSDAGDYRRRLLERASKLGIALNSLLFLGKLVVSLMSGSIALISDTLNSFADILASVGIHVAVRIGNKQADANHPFGHARVEPLSGIVVAIFTGILGFEVLRSGIGAIINYREVTHIPWVVGILLATIAVKAFMTFYFFAVSRSFRSPGLKATAVDSRNDVLISGIALMGVAGTWQQVFWLEGVAAIIISGFILFSAFTLGKENIDFLVGKAPPEEMIRKISDVVMKVEGVEGINLILAHYVGNTVHIEIHVELDGSLQFSRAHDIGMDVQDAVERLGDVNRAFIHVDPA